MPLLSWSFINDFTSLQRDRSVFVSISRFVIRFTTNEKQTRSVVSVFLFVFVCLVGRLSVSVPACLSFHDHVITMYNMEVSIQLYYLCAETFSILTPRLHKPFNKL